MVGRITVVTWNAQGSRRPDPAAMAAALRELEPDLVLLQEVQRHQLRAIASATGWAGTWRFKHWGVRIPPEGLGILVRGSIDAVRRQILAHPYGWWNWRRRIAVQAAVTVAGRRLAVVDTHLGAGVPAAERVRQIGVLLDATTDAVLIAGDLNAEPGSAELRTFRDAGWWDAERRVRPDVTRPSTNWAPGPRTAPPTQRLDYVLVRDATTVVDAFVPDDWGRWAALSDHVPVVARLSPAG
jgi:endonuclease/exonuclease/phosphatase family metal-dependent hydrolase